MQSKYLVLVDLNKVHDREYQNCGFVLSAVLIFANRKEKKKPCVEISARTTNTNSVK